MGIGEIMVEVGGQAVEPWQTDAAVWSYDERMHDGAAGSAGVNVTLTRSRIIAVLDDRWLWALCKV